jgi:hypothetical protein
MRIKRQVIRAHRPLRNLAALVLVLVAAGAAAYSLHLNARSATQNELIELRTERDSLQQTVELLRESNATLRERVAIVERGQQVERKAYSDVDQHLRGLQDEVLALKEEVAFYRGIVSSGKEKGLKIQTLVLDKENSHGAYRFQLVLTQHMKRVKLISGTVKLSVTDLQGGQSKGLAVSDLSGRELNPVAFEFKYFQRLEGRFTLPEGFEPSRLQIKVTSSGKKPANLEQAYDWQGLVS